MTSTNIQEGRARSMEGIKATTLKHLYTRIRDKFIELCEPLDNCDFNLQAEFFVSPPKWHLAHTTWFFEEMVLKEFKPGYQVFHNGFSRLFNSYYESVGTRIDRDKRGLISRPGVREVYNYRKQVDAEMLELIDAQATEIHDIVLLGLNHEQQHQELLLTDLQYSLSFNPMHPVVRASWDMEDQQNKETGWLAVDEGIYDIGHQGEGFCLDNELGRHQVFIGACEVNKALVTNGEYLAFMEDGGYEKFMYWHDEGWHWKNKHGIAAPLYWKKIDGQWHRYSLAGMKPVKSGDIIGHISFYEASAFARWKDMRLATEFEWEAASGQLQWGNRWEWTNSAYLPYPGFTITEGAVGEYNGKFMVNQMVLRGASAATPENHARHTYRNFFSPEMRWQLTGIRLAR